MSSRAIIQEHHCSRPDNLLLPVNHEFISVLVLKEKKSEYDKMGERSLGLTSEYKWLQLRPFTNSCYIYK